MIRETTYTGARKNLAALMDQMETDRLLRSPKNAERLQEAIARADAGEGESMEIEELRGQFGLRGA
ncbi:MAG: hypothetical protein F4Y07_13015 [Gemmatimonadetes bacterium]|nr:hypothetical protein [Gemmatimonadota bacterium]MYE17389.1 hypothetical protein [Gemmatimonadota bacterium]